MTLFQILLWPLSLVYGMGARLRVWCYRKGMCKQRRLNGVVISVGNLTTGGTGKTPMVLQIARQFAQENLQVAILTRGYRGSRSPSALLHDCVEKPEGEIPSHIRSDEAWLLWRRLGEQVRMSVGRDRHAAGLRLEQIGVNCFILDDGFQHLTLARDADIVLLDATNAFGGARLLPAGRLREPKSALARAHLVIITRSEHSEALEAMVRRFSKVPIFYAQTILEDVLPWKVESVGSAKPDWRGKHFFAFCGIGNPDAFFDDLRRWEIPVVGQIAFRDHRHYSQHDAARIESRARSTGADALICTEKDLFNILPVQFRSLPVFYARISLRVAEEERFWRLLKGRVQARLGSAQ